MKEIRMIIQCPSCNGTGVYVGLGEGEGTAVVCSTCKGRGWYEYVYNYNEFSGRKHKDGVDRVYLDGYGYKLGSGKINFDGVGEIDMDREGVSYKEFVAGKMPTHIEKLGCPMTADQGKCHDINGFVDRCNSFNGGWLNTLADCKNMNNKAECWEIFNRGTL